MVAAAVALMVFGAGQLQDARTDAFPEFAPPRVEVQTISLGLSPEETEEFVTVPLEQTLNGVPGSTRSAPPRLPSCRRSS